MKVRMSHGCRGGLGRVQANHKVRLTRRSHIMDAGLCKDLQIRICRVYSDNDFGSVNELGNSC